VHERTESITLLAAHAIREIGDSSRVGEIASERECAVTGVRKRGRAIARLIHSAIDQQECRTALRQRSGDDFADLAFASRASEKHRCAESGS
jgi:hypothetical protein